MQTHDLQQGTKEWHAFRHEHFGASEAPAMMGESPYKSRSDLLREKATGIVPEVDAATQRRFDEGHRFEALARDLAEEKVGEELYPVVCSSGRLAASLDGLTMLGDVYWEHKSMNDALRAVRDHGAELPLVYQIQMEQQAMVTGAERGLFMASAWDEVGELTEPPLMLWYTPQPHLAARIKAGWEQFEADLANYTPEPAVEPVTAQAADALPAVFAQVSGSLSVTSNLDLFGDALRTFVARIPKKPETDQEFADTEAACKKLKEAEDRLSAAEDQALASLTSVEQMRRTVADLKDLARQTRLASEKLVKARKEEIRTSIIVDARTQFTAHINALQAEIKGVRFAQQMPDFAGAIKGLKTLSSIRDAADTALANAKIEANELAADIRGKLSWFDSNVPAEYHGLFRDLDDLVTIAPNHFEAAVSGRVEQHKAAETKKLEAERERIRQEEADKAKADAQAKIDRIREAAQAAPGPDKPEERRPTPLHGAHGAIAYDADGHKPQPASPDEPATLTLGDINARLAPLNLSAAGLAELGVQHTATRKAAKLYRESDFERICAAIISHINEIRELEAA